MKLNVKAFALAGGLVCALWIFCATWWVMLFLGDTGDPTVIGKYYYLGYSISPIGSVIGAIYAFFDGGIGTLIFAGLYNLLVGRKG